MNYRLLWCAENAIKIEVEFDKTQDVGFFAQLRGHIRKQKYAWLQDVVAAESSVTIFFNLFTTGYLTVKQQLIACLADFSAKSAGADESLITLPVRYGGEIGEDLNWVASASDLTVAEVIKLHQEATYTVTAVGFSPGFGYLKGLPKSLRLPRRASPRLSVPAGALAIAEQYTAVYPQTSPGGWHIIGCCEESLFDVSLPQPALFKVGQSVRFVSVE